MNQIAYKYTLKNVQMQLRTDKMYEKIVPQTELCLRGYSVIFIAVMQWFTYEWNNCSHTQVLHNSIKDLSLRRIINYDQTEEYWNMYSAFNCDMRNIWIVLV